MMDMITVTAKTVNDAITQASLQLGVSSDRLQYEVIEKGSAGILGGLIGAKPAVIRAKKIETIDDKYHVYLGITKDYDIALKLKQIYESEGYQIYIKEVTLDNMEFSNNLEQFDLLIENAKNKNEILTIEEVVLANYEEIIQKN